MKALSLLFLIVCAIEGSANAQTLFSYGPYKVDKQEFLWAFHKNNAPATVKGWEASKRSYLQLYINYKLKVQAARDAGMDKTGDYTRDVHSFQTQVTDQTMKNLEGMGALSLEALKRGQTDIEISQIFVGFPTLADTAGALKRIEEAREQLQKGIPFETVATAYGTNPLLKSRGGYTGFITVFSLPYAAENLVYALPTGAYSAIYRSRSGYHIFKKLGQRPNPGAMLAAQILVTFAPKATDAEKLLVRERAYKIFDSLKNGAPFDSLVRKFSDDKMTYYNNGLLPEFTTGDFDPAFESAAFALPKDGSISEPVATSFGYHIIKRIGLQAPLNDSIDSRRWSTWQQKVYYSDRMDVGREKFAESILPVLKYHSYHTDTAWLSRITDTLLTGHSGEAYIKTVPKVPLFSLGETSRLKTYATDDWLRYLLYRRAGELRNRTTCFASLLKAFIHTSALEYYAANLDSYNLQYHYLVKEFAEGTLLFGIMQQEVWNKANGDSTALLHWFEQHRDRFVLPPSVDAVTFSYPDSAQGSGLFEQMKKNPYKWRIWMTDHINIIADSAHFELSALSLDSAYTHAGMITTPALQTDNNWHFYFVAQIYPPAAARNFEEAKGLVLGDYQTTLEQKWVSSLRKKYPVTIYQSSSLQNSH